jgi:basic amino acid/polyamine antiporter, APA family
MSENPEEPFFQIPDGKKIGLLTATAIVVANMVGTGVFTSLGFQAMAISSPFALLMLWVAGGITALCGALTYGELSASMPRSGGEYIYLSRIFHPLLGFLSGWVSVTVGFAAPTALAAMALGSYTASVFPQINPTYTGLGVVLAVTLMHTISLSFGSFFQVLLTMLKVVLILFFVGSALFLSAPLSHSFGPSEKGWHEVMSPAFAVSLVYVTYAYSGWNAAIYLASEVRNPAKILPRALTLGTLLVMVLYLMLNFIFLYTTPLDLLKGKLEVGFVAANQIFGPLGGKAMGLIIALLLISTLSAMIFAGPRVAMSMGEDMPALKLLGKKNKNGLPINAILFQLLITVFLIITSSFDQVITYSSFTLALFTVITVLGLFVLRIRKQGVQHTYKTPLYPLPPLLFLAITTWTLIYVAQNRPVESVYGLLTLVAGIPVYFFARNKKPLS